MDDKKTDLTYYIAQLIFLIFVQCWNWRDRNGIQVKGEKVLAQKAKTERKKLGKGLRYKKASFPV
jgi:hypothetical protein